jgi:hypothetical protein
MAVIKWGIISLICSSYFCPRLLYDSQLFCFNFIGYIIIRFDAGLDGEFKRHDEQHNKPQSHWQYDGWLVEHHHAP